MIPNINNSSSIPMLNVIPIEEFPENINCPICLNNEPKKGIAHEGQEGHVVHAKCLRTWIKNMLDQNPNLPVGFVKCFHCQVALHPTGINNEVFEQKIPKGLFTRTLKFASKVPEKAQKIMHLINEKKLRIFIHITLYSISCLVGIGMLTIGSTIWNQALSHISSNLQHPGLIGNPDFGVWLILLLFAFAIGPICGIAILKLDDFLKGNQSNISIHPNELLLLPSCLLMAFLVCGTAPISHQQ